MDQTKRNMGYTGRYVLIRLGGKEVVLGRVRCLKPHRKGTDVPRETLVRMGPIRLNCVNPWCSNPVHACSITIEASTVLSDAFVENFRENFAIQLEDSVFPWPFDESVCKRSKADPVLKRDQVSWLDRLPFWAATSEDLEGPARGRRVGQAQEGGENG